MIVNSPGFNDFLTEIKQKIAAAQYEAFRAVNNELINLYWEIGKSIVAKQEAYGWGKSVVQTLADELQKEFVGMKGFSVRNLWNMRTFYLEYKESEKLQTLSAQIGWSHNVVIFQKFKPEYAGKMNFYLSALNDTVKLADENPSIGIIICKEKKRTTVEYALRDSSQPIGVSTYTLSETLPIDLRGFLPTTQEIEEKLLSFFDKEKNQ